VHFYRPFAVVSGPAGSFLERCDARVRIPVGGGGTIAAGGLVASQSLVLWLGRPDGSAAARGIGVQLPSLRDVTLALPRGIGPPLAAALDDYRLYVVSQAGVVWSAALPPSG
jgi:hypothetical protein